ncbi:nitronate monooxygenase [Roseomonas sp. JC162]|uniref:Nitronate monooxygenase n=1 Tax=Neoroseomonas marina TaxID=1232220 RepID=A0A848EGW1_9PROT|nr:nitronate monooxygenase [Neoroseomonas marina]NMJ42645.1 nitronate monooxygenase [Neoroseomonas marina]
MPFRNRLTERLGIEHPVLLAPMDYVAGGRLAAAVSQAGGLGLIGGGYGDGPWLGRAFDAAGNARVGCGFITWSLAKQPALLGQALARGPAAVMLSFGDPRPFAREIHEAGATLICQVQTVAQAHEAMEAGAGVIVAQGTEAGGHGQSLPLTTLLPLVVEACPDIPVVAAGGIADGRGLAAAMTYGAEGVMMGTRFYVTEEADIDPRAKARAVAAGPGETVRSIVFDIARKNVWPAPYTGRVLRNATTERWLGREAEMQEHAEEVAADYAVARARGDFDVAGVIVGEASALIHDIPPAAAVVECVVREAEAAIARAARV